MPDSAEYMPQLEAISGGFQRAQILFTALRGGLFKELERPRSAAEVATALGWSLRGTTMLLDALPPLGLAEKEGETYRNTPIASDCLVPGAPFDQTHILAHKAGSWDAWSRLEEVVRTGSPAPRPEPTEAQTRDFICGMKDVGTESARAMAEAVDLSAFKHMLDIGGGPATYTMTFLQANPGMRGTVFDLPNVVPIGKEMTAEAGLEGRVDFIAGDMNKDSLGSGYDLILISNIIHSLSPEENRALVKKCHAAMEPGGMLIIKDFLVDPGRTGPAFSLTFAIHMLVHTEGGGTYERGEVAAWTGEAGFGPGEYLDLTPQTRLWMVRKELP